MGDNPRKNSKQQFEDDFLLLENNDPDESGDSEEQINLPRSLILVERLIYTIEDEELQKQFNTLHKKYSSWVGLGRIGKSFVQKYHNLLH